MLDVGLCVMFFRYLEDLAESTGTENIKLLEGLIVAAETLGGEVIFFSISGKYLWSSTTCSHWSLNKVLLRVNDKL